MWLCPVCMSPRVTAPRVSVGEERRCPRSNAPKPSSPLRMGLWFTGSQPGTSCWADWLMGMFPLPSWTPSGVMLGFMAAGWRSQGGSMTIKSICTWSLRKVMLVKIIQGKLCDLASISFFIFYQLLWNHPLLRACSFLLVGHNVSQQSIIPYKICRWFLFFIANMILKKLFSAFNVNHSIYFLWCSNS